VLHHAGNGSDLRPELSGLHRDIFNWWRLHRLQLYLDCPVQCDGFGPTRTMLRQSIFRTTRAASAALMASDGLGVPADAATVTKIMPWVV
jgi:hypothetical protein